MNWNLWLYKWHKWFAVVAGSLTLIWFASGVVMTLPHPLLKSAPRSGASLPEAPSFQQATVAVPDAIAVVEKVADDPIQVTGVSLRRFHGRLLYSISTSRGSYWVDALTGERFAITEAVAREIITAALGEDRALRTVSLIREYQRDYTWGPLPAYRFEFDDSPATIGYVSVEDGGVRSSDRLGRMRAFVEGSHTLEFLKPFLPTWSVKLTMLVFSFLGLVMTLLGGTILWLQLRSWWQRRWRTV